MKSTGSTSCLATLPLLLVASANVVAARPHAHGLFDNIRRLVHPTKLNLSHSGTPATVSSSEWYPFARNTACAILTQAGSACASLQRHAHPCYCHKRSLCRDKRWEWHHICDSFAREQPAWPKALGIDLTRRPSSPPSGCPSSERTPWITPQAHQSRLLHQRQRRSSRYVFHTLTCGCLDKANLRAYPESPATPIATVPHGTKATRVARQVQTVASDPNDGGYQSWVLAGFSKPTSAAAASSLSTSLCPANNGTVFRSSSGITYQTICGVDYGDNIRPFLLVSSFEACIQKCDAHNYNTHGVTCVAALFAPNRLSGKDDCYLKSSIAHPSFGPIVEGAIRYSVAQSAHLPASATSSSLLASLSSTSRTTSHSSLSYSRSSSTSSPVASATVSPPGVTYGTGSSVVAPRVVGNKLHGPSENRPTSQYIQYDSAQGITLSKSLLRVGVNGDLSTGYDISPQTGVLDVNIYTQNALAPLRNTPHISRDGGRGGYLNGQHIFMFCDTGSYSTTTTASNGDFLDFVSSSVAVDVGMNALAGNPIHLQDGIGAWSDNVGRQRGFAPLTQGEQAYNIAMQGQGQRYALWIESSLIPLDAATGIVYAPIVYDNVNMVTREAVFTYTGNTLLRITAGGRGGPVAQRPIRKLFDQDEPEWGVPGGLRSWGPSGIGGTDGRVYLFADVSGGLLMARVAADSIEDRDAVSDASSLSLILANPISVSILDWGILDNYHAQRHIQGLLHRRTNHGH